MRKEIHKSRVTIDFPIAEYRRLKVVVALMGMSMSDFVMGCVHDELEKQLPKEPNKKTLQVFSDTDAGKNLTVYKDIEGLIDDLENELELKRTTEKPLDMSSKKRKKEGWEKKKTPEGKPSDVIGC